MGKIICEVCGTVYQDSADACPICGYSRDKGGFDQGEDLLRGVNETENQADYGQPSYFDDYAMDGSDFDQTGYRQPDPYAGYEPQPEPQRGQRPIFDYDAVNPQDRGPYDSYQDVGNEVTLNDYPEESYDNYDNGGDQPRSHKGLIIFLVLLILLLIAASGFLFMKFLLPNMNPAPETVPATVMTEAPTTEPTTEPTVPCTSLALVDGGKVDLSKEGQFYLIHATFAPEDTTDVLTYTSEDETIILVDEGGKITAVGEGDTNVVLTCGSQVIKLPVHVEYREETEPVETETEAPAIREGEEQETAGEESSETEAPAAEKVVELKLKKTDVTFGIRGVSAQLELDCALSPEEVKWSSTDNRVAQVKDGLVTTVGPGVCKIVARYGDQEASCVVRCNFQ